MIGSLLSINTKSANNNGSPDAERESFVAETVKWHPGTERNEAAT